MIRIITDSSSNLNLELAQKYNIEIMPLSISFGKEEFLDGVNISHEEFYRRLKTSDTLPKTSQINPVTFENKFSEYLALGDEIIGIFISSELSGTFQSANIAKLNLSSDKIHLIDSRTVSSAISLLCIEAARLRDNDKTAEEIVALIEEMLPHVKIYAAVTSLEYLKKGGRLNSIEALCGNLLKINPVVTTEDGKVAVAGKFRSNASLINFFKDKLKQLQIQNNTDFFYLDIENKEKLDILKENCKDYVNRETKEHHSSTIGAAVGTHVGPGAFGFAFIEQYESAILSAHIEKSA